MQKITFQIALALFSTLVVACSKPNLTPSVQPADKIPLTQALVVVSIRFVDKVDDLKQKERLYHQSQFLADDEELLEKNIRIMGQPTLSQPMHHIYDFRFYFEDKQGNTTVIQKFNLDLRDYESIGIYAFEPGEWKLKSMRYNFVGLKRSTPSSQEEDEEQHHYHDFVTIPEVSFKLQAGQVHYLGNLTLHYRTQQIKYGLFPVRFLNKQVELWRLQWADKQAETQQNLQAMKPWFKAKQWVNLSQNVDWAYLQYNDWTTYTEPAEDENLETEDTETFF